MLVRLKQDLSCEVVFGGVRVSHECLAEGLKVGELAVAIRGGRVFQSGRYLRTSLTDCHGDGGAELCGQEAVKFRLGYIVVGDIAADGPPFSGIQVNILSEVNRLPCKVICTAVDPMGQKPPLRSRAQTQVFGKGYVILPSKNREAVPKAWSEVAKKTANVFSSLLLPVE